MVENILLLLIIMGSLLARRISRNWIAPGAFFSLYWCFYTIASIVIVGRPDGLTIALVWVFLATFSFLIGTIFGSGMGWNWRKSPDNEHTPGSNCLSLRRIFMLLILIDIVEIILIIHSAGYPLRVSSVAGISARNRSLFYSGLVKHSTMEMILLPFVYASALFGGKLFQNASSRSDKIVAISSLAAVWIIGMLYGSRMGALFGGTFWISAYMASRIANRRNTKFRCADMIGVIAFLAVLFILAFVAMIARYGDTALVGSKAMARSAQPFTFFWAFAHWISNESWEISTPLWGRQTFRGILSHFGITGYPLYPIWTPKGSTTLATAFVDFIQDFGYVGALIWLFLWGFFGELFYRKVSEGRDGYIPGLTVVYVFILNSISFSFLRYNAIVLALLLFWLYHVACKLRSRAPGRSTGKRFWRIGK